jgi:acetyl esterase/lipase
MRKLLLASLAVAWLVLPVIGHAQASAPDGWAQTIAERYVVLPDITYLTINNYALKLDVYQPRKPASAVPTVIYFHGGGWVSRDKDEATLRLLPYLQMGWAVVNVDYRLAGAALAPAAVEDCRCALRWVAQHAADYKFDSSRIVLIGASAGGHLALMAGMAPHSAGLDEECPAGDDVRVAAIVNWFGITDVADLLGGKNQRDYAVAWLGKQKDRKKIARRLSPLTYVPACRPSSACMPIKTRLCRTPTRCACIARWPRPAFPTSWSPSAARSTAVMRRKMIWRLTARSQPSWQGTASPP